KEACRTNKSWQEEGYRPITVTVNLSSKQFYQPQLSKRIEKILQETALDPRYLELEIIETTILNKSPEVKQILHSLKSLGLSLALDDFGTGHTSLTYLRDFPISTVKIDQSFIKPLPTDTKNAAITQAMIALAHQLGLRVVAEGVETAEQLQFLSKLNCDEIQGYWFSQPLPASELRVLFSQLPLSL
ncbi:MAG TPA: EAL domain-containing protein, partial [Gammaproteobacteria bacterium]|nr:EAL domain-containing protein [Gammaproteobacteria bacterium]